jgi:hypothetical protein
MKLFLLCFFFLSFLEAYALEGLSIQNAYQVDKVGQVFRGREPKTKIIELAEFGITDVIIFKNQLRTEVDQEIVSLKKLGLRYHHIPFRWKN